MSKVAEDLAQFWHKRLLEDYPSVSQAQRDSIIKWLLGRDVSRFESLEPEKLKVISGGIDYRYGILQQRYLFVNPTHSYRNLLNRLGSVVTLRQKISTWIALSRERQQLVADVLQEVIQEMLNSDRYIQEQMVWINQSTTDPRLRNSLLFTALEEYCLRPIRNQPLLAYRFVNFLRRKSRGGITQVPQQQIIRLLSEEIGLDESESTVSLLDNKAINDYQESQAWEEKQILRLKVVQELEAYLAQEVGQEAVLWLKLYLAGRSQDAIANELKLPIKQVYRLREKVSYHAIRVFALKGKPELVSDWLEISIKDHNLGLTPKQWAIFCQELNPNQQEIIKRLKKGEKLEDIGEKMGLKKNQITGEWSKIYLAAQRIRSSESA